MNTYTSYPIAIVIGCCLITPTVRGQDQPKPGPEHKKLEMLVGEWKYEGSGEATPFFPAAAKFKGKYTCRLVLSGFFVESKAEDTNEKGYIFQNIWICGYDANKKTYVSHTFENDGSISDETMTFTGNSWTTSGTRPDSKGKVYKTRTTDTYSVDGKTVTEVSEYSGDDGKTWSLSYKMVAKKVRG